MRPLVILSVMGLGLASCGGDTTHSLASEQSGGQLAVDSGDVIEVTLESNASTGYGWQITAMPEFVELSGDEYVAADSDLVGAPGTHVFTFQVIEAGAGILRLDYTRLFDDPPVPERVAEYIIVADDAAWPPETTGPPPVTGTATAGVDVNDLLDLGPGDVSVHGFVVWDESSARLCEVLLESYPPQCGGGAVEIADPEALTVDIEEARGVRWTPNAVTLVGFFDGDRLTLNG